MGRAGIMFDAGVALLLVAAGTVALLPFGGAGRALVPALVVLAVGLAQLVGTVQQWRRGTTHLIRRWLATVLALVVFLPTLLFGGGVDGGLVWLESPFLWAPLAFMAFFTWLLRLALRKTGLLRDEPAREADEAQAKP